MKKILVSSLFAAMLLHAADASKFDGTWKLDPKKSDFSNSQNGTPREATLIITDDGWTYTVTDAKGKKTNLSFDRQATNLKGDSDMTVKYEPIGNPSVSEMRMFPKGSDKEVMRVLSTLLPDGNTLMMYGSGVSEDGKSWSDVSYWKKVK